MTGPVILKPLPPPGAALPALGLIPGGSFSLETVLARQAAAKVPVHLVFPARSAQEAPNLAHLLNILAPLHAGLIDQVWLALGGRRPGALARLAGARLFEARRHPPPDQQDAPLGKGAVMRAMLHHLVTVQGVTHPRAIVLFLDADIRPAFFHPGWVLDPVGALLTYPQAEAAKLVYHRPRGGRLNAMLRSLLALCPHAGVQALLDLAYLLSGEIAGTMRFWTKTPFKTGYGVEIRLLLAFALEQLQLTPGAPDLAHLAQVYVGAMDHRHSPMVSSPKRPGLDQMAHAVFHTLLEVLEQAGILKWPGGNAIPAPLGIPIPGPDHGLPQWLPATVAEQSLPPLARCPEVQAALALARG
jgi:hypothetical protein